MSPSPSRGPAKLAVPVHECPICECARIRHLKGIDRIASGHMRETASSEAVQGCAKSDHAQNAGDGGCAIFVACVEANRHGPLEFDQEAAIPSHR